MPQDRGPRRGKAAGSDPPRERAESSRRRSRGSPGAAAPGFPAPLESLKALEALLEALRRRTTPRSEERAIAGTALRVLARLEHEGWIHVLCALPREAVASLTERERAVRRLVLAGLSDAGIARALGISARTVEVHVQNIYRKLGIDNRVGLALVALALSA